MDADKKTVQDVTYTVLHTRYLVIMWIITEIISLNIC